ncbi:hypothetical protein Bca4012_083772 [Brassica carinata]
MDLKRITQLNFLGEEDTDYVNLTLFQEFYFFLYTIVNFSFYVQAIKVLHMIKLHGKPICLNKASQNQIIDVGANLWKQLKRWLIFTFLPKDAH